MLTDGELHTLATVIGSHRDQVAKICDAEFIDTLLQGSLAVWDVASPDDPGAAQLLCICAALFAGALYR